MTVAVARGPAAGLRLIVGHAAMYGAARAAVSGFDLMLTPLYARQLSPDDLGLIAVAISLQAVIGILYTMGLDGALFRLFYTPGTSESDRQRVIGATVVGTTCTAVVVATSLAVLGPAVSDELLAGMDVRVFRLLVWGSVLNMYPLLLLQLLQMRQQSGRYLLVATGYTALRVATTGIALVMLGRGVAGWAEALALTAAGGAAFAAVYVWRDIRFGGFAPILRDAVGYAVPQLGHQLSRWVAVAASRPILAAMLPLSQIGVYQVALTIGQALGLLTTALSLAYGPAFMEAARQSEADTAVRYGRLASVSAAIVIVLAGLGSMWREVAVTIVAGSNYLIAAPLVPILMLDAVIQSLYLTLAAPIFLRKESAKRLPIRTALSGVVNLAAITTLVPLVGVYGAAWAMVLANVALVMTVFPLSQQSLRMRYDYGVVGQSAAVTLAVLMASMVLTEVLNTTLAHTGTAVLSIALGIWAVRMATNGSLFAPPAASQS